MGPLKQNPGLGRAGVSKDDRAAKADRLSNIPLRRSTQDRRSPTRRRLILHLYQCGPRPLLEALLAVDAGQPLDSVLADFARVPPEIYCAVGADVLDDEPVLLAIAGGRR